MKVYARTARVFGFRPDLNAAAIYKNLNARRVKGHGVRIL
jgi:hypothetical protein